MSSSPFSRLKKRLLKLELILTGLLIFFPLILILITNQIRSSISDYAYSNESEWFVFLLTIASSLFVTNGSLFNKHWYNIILGISLAGVALTPHLDLPIIHTILAAIFFLGSIYVMIHFSSPEQRIYKIITGALIALAMLGHFLLNFYSLFWAEWIGIIPISLHFIGESLGKID